MCWGFPTFERILLVFCFGMSEHKSPNSISHEVWMRSASHLLRWKRTAHAHMG